MKKIHITTGILAVLILVCVSIICSFMAGEVNAKYKGLSNGGILPSDYKINGIDVSNLSIAEAKEVIKSNLGKTQINLCGTDVDIGKFTEITFEFGADDVGIFSYIKDKGRINVKIDYNVDKNKLKNIIKNIDCKMPENARITFSNGKAVIIPEIAGNVLKVTDEMVEEMENSIKYGRKLDLEKYYKKPKVSENDLKDDLDRACKWNDYKININTGNNKLKTLNLSEKLIWNGKKAFVPEKWIKEKVKKIANKYNTYGKTRDFVTNSGENIKVAGGTMGWQLDNKKIISAICKAVKKNKKNVEAVWINKASEIWDNSKGNDIGNTYVEVSTSSQKVWYYKNGELKLESSAVTGLPTEERVTKKGVHHILYKQRDRILRGAAGAWNSFVNYWMPFTLDGQGLHDASWRKSFGSNIYQYNGSHGCVNLPVSFAGQLYELVDAGTPVIVY
ncbi:MAG: L,D-transpeptidase family protein [Clostridia bacterium]|nr:L,D-transpeptidase family protein [Clostridia bacterium]